MLGEQQNRMKASQSEGRYVTRTACRDHRTLLRRVILSAD